MRDLTFKMKAYIVSVPILTALCLVFFISNNYIPVHVADYVDILFFSLLMMATESFMVPFRGIAVSTSFAVQLAAFLLFKPLTAIIIMIIGFSLRVVKFNGKFNHILNTPLYKTLYNYSALVLPIILGNFLYVAFNGTFLLENIWGEILHISVFCITVFIVNTLLASILFSLLHNKNILYFFISNLKLGLLSSIAMAPFGLLLAFVFKKYSFGGVLLLLFPIILARYTFSLYIESKTQYVQTVDSLMRAMEARDKYTEGHSQRVAEIACEIARELKYNDIKIEQINIAALLHDVGKIGIDDQILNKPGKLTEEEYKIIKSHPEIGYNILKDIKNLENILPIVRHHHEMYDGKGYPEGKMAEELNLDVFIIQLADSIDAMATDRPYRKALSKEQIISEITKYSGSQFHPKVVQAYLNIIEKKAV
ncbi:HD-GYP domain-containing protein [Clostridium sp. SYSU_GA19001]|uniref:HD-GYP domain-containing protein n=1 Tax=Clostridium caldaquaticum TaxID=2940653 RepID=UPI00207751E6|nr:HD-GYP domain-containing protein [Clostridium caldaquaticum]MCM8711499.1 HD-GYP domain-containing protein [Clostridium caldaquaticum]